MKHVVNSFYDTDTYCIKRGYIHRKNAEAFDDTQNEDAWQEEVYEKAYHIFLDNKYRNLLDIGCGSGYKTIKYFKDFPFTGVETDTTLMYLKNKYPRYHWMSPDEVLGRHFDMIICADVIEHIADPDAFIRKINDNITFDLLIISTPDRKILESWWHFGPPRNPSHYREWTFSEFHKFIGRYFEIKEHFISNYHQATQVIVCKPYKAGLS